MAVPKPSLRSSALKEVAQGSLPTGNLAQANDSHHSKRGRQTSSDRDSDASSKRLKTSPPETKASNLLRPKREALQHLPFRDRTTNGVTGVTRDTKSRIDPVLVQPRNTNNNSIAPHDPSHRGINQNVPLPNKDQVDKRSLRSHDGGSRLKCELSQYFSNYDELISIEPRKQGRNHSNSCKHALADTFAADIVTPHTKVHIVDASINADIPASGDQTNSFTGHDKDGGRNKRKGYGKSSECMRWPDHVLTDLTDATRLSFPTQPSQRPRSSSEDPLDDNIFLKVHLREERKEKQLRNIEKERAMHEKVQLERILDGLRGHDWLRVMGISGITDGEKRLYEPKRDHLIKEVRALLEKFRLWKEEEKRRKAEKEETMDESEDDADDEEEEEDDQGSDVDGNSSDQEEVDSDAESTAISDGDPPGYSEAEAAERQLRMEALQASRSHIQHAKAAAPVVEEPFQSFYAKPYLRQAAVGKHRRSGRTILAFGHPIPQLWQRDFELDDTIRTPEALMESGRRMRMLRREEEG